MGFARVDRLDDGRFGLETALPFAGYSRICNTTRSDDLNPAILNSQLVQVALPIVLTIFIAAWMNGRSIDGINKRIDDLRSYMTGLHDGLKTDLTSLRADMNTRFGEVNRRLDRIDETLKTHTEKIAALDERTSPLGRR
jgi:hypothetical protein